MSFAEGKQCFELVIRMRRILSCCAFIIFLFLTLGRKDIVQLLINCGMGANAEADRKLFLISLVCVVS